jgi:very-short-patch-repair endonuclease
VLHAIAFALRDIHILFQHYVFSDKSNCAYYIDAYFPGINIAVEIDEEHHKSVQNAERDRIRQLEITEIFGCEFIRINAYSKPVFQQVDNLIDTIRAKLILNAIPVWQRKAPEEQFRGGVYSAEHIEQLEESGAFVFMENLAEEVRDIGFRVTFESLDGIPSPGNGEAGFSVRGYGLTMILLRRSKPTLKLLAMNQGSADLLANRGYQTTGCQLKNRVAPRFFEVKKGLDSTHMLDFLRSLKNEIATQPIN